MSCGVGCRHGSDPALLWLWHGPAAAAQIRPLAWEPPQVVSVALKRQKGQKKKKKKKKKKKDKETERKGLNYFIKFCCRRFYHINYSTNPI